MNKYYISSGVGESGISKYSRDFFELVLKHRGYEFIESSEHLSTIMTKVRSIDNVHIEIGIFQQREIEILFAMLAAGYSKVDVTLHDAPIVRYPFRSFRNRLLINFSKFFDIYIDRFSSARPFVTKIRVIYVLSRKGVEVTKKTFNIDNVHFLPHVLDPAEIRISPVTNNNFIYFGFIGKNKGLEYSLKLHRKLLEFHPDSNFYVVGKALGREQMFYKSLQDRYTHNVHYLGFVPEIELDTIFDKASYAILPFKQYRFFVPLSGSILYNQKMGKVVFTTRVNVTPELIADEKNGYFLSGNLNDDKSRISGVFTNPSAVTRVKKEMFNRLLESHTPDIVSQYIVP